VWHTGVDFALGEFDPSVGRLTRTGEQWRRHGVGPRSSIGHFFLVAMNFLRNDVELAAFLRFDEPCNRGFSGTSFVGSTSTRCCTYDLNIQMPAAKAAQPVNRAK
jgi:hypothetical protein